MKERKYASVQNRECEYYPCHKGIDESEFSCLFCYCPLMFKDCSNIGNPGFIDVKGKKIKDCSNCTFPHHIKNYDKMIGRLKEEIYK